MQQAITETKCPNLELLARGKVRDIYAIPNDPAHLLFVATDRLSAFDVVLANGVAGKGKILTQLSQFWFNLPELCDIIDNHCVSCEWRDMPAACQEYRDQLEGRVMLVKKLKILPVEAIVRGYLSGSAWVEYKRSVTVCGMAMPAGLHESQKIPNGPLYTPSTKAEIGGHDENIHPDKVADIIQNAKLAQEMAEKAVRLYTTAAEYALKRGIIIADTKFEFGVDDENNLVLCDEVLTPDSSRFWPADQYQVGKSQPSFDKQIVRDYLTSINFNKTDSVELPEDVVSKAVAKYQQVFELLTATK